MVVFRRWGTARQSKAMQESNEGSVVRPMVVTHQRRWFIKGRRGKDVTGCLSAVPR